MENETGFEHDESGSAYACVGMIPIVVNTATAITGTAKVGSLAGARMIIVIGPLELGGSERQALLFARYLQEVQGAAVEVWGTSGGPGRLSELCDRARIPWRLVPTPWYRKRAAKLPALAGFARELRRAKPLVILPYMEELNLVCGLVWRMTGARLCVWNQRDDGSARIHSRYGPLATRLTPRFIANSKEGAEHLMNERSAPRARVRVVHNGVELLPPEANRLEWRKRLRLTPDCFVACMVANLTRYKDHDTLLRAWHIVVERTKAAGQESALLLAGRFDVTHESLKALAYDLDLSGSVRFLGPVKDVSGLLATSDVGVLCSNSEGSPNAVLEYMAADLPVAGTDIPAMREVLIPENHEFLAPPQDAGALAANIVSLALAPESRARLGAANRRHAESAFGSRRMCEETLEVIAEGLEERGLNISKGSSFEGTAATGRARSAW